MPPRKRKHAPAIVDPELSGSSDDEASKGALSAARSRPAHASASSCSSTSQSHHSIPTAQGGRPAKSARGRGGAPAGAGRLVSSFFQAQKDVGSTRTLADLDLGAAEGEEESLREYLASLPQRNAAAKAAARARHEAQVRRSARPA